MLVTGSKCDDSIRLYLGHKFLFLISLPSVAGFSVNVIRMNPLNVFLWFSSKLIPSHARLCAPMRISDMICSISILSSSALFFFRSFSLFFWTVLQQNNLIQQAYHVSPRIYSADTLTLWITCAKRYLFFLSLSLYFFSRFLMYKFLNTAWVSKSGLNKEKPCWNFFMALRTFWFTFTESPCRNVFRPYSTVMFLMLSC